MSAFAYRMLEKAAGGRQSFSQCRRLPFMMKVILAANAMKL